MASSLRDVSAAALSPDCTVIRELLPTERLLFASDSTCVGTFECATENPLFHRDAPSTAHCLVFSRTAVWIQHERGPRYVADPTVVTLHNKERAYRRWRIARDGDRCDWLAFSDESLRDVLLEQWFPREFTPIHGEVYGRQRALFERIGRGFADALEIEETATLLLADVLASIDTPSRTRDFDAVQHVRATIAADPASATSLRVLARRVQMTPFRLCRAFRRAAGETMTAYRTKFRLLSSLEPLRTGGAITDIALAHGFNSHSHYTAAFRTAFGMTPSMWRRQTC